MKKHYRLIILVYAAETHVLYRFMKKVWLTYFQSSPDIKVFFCYGANSGLGKEEWDLCYEDLPETNISGIRKVIRAMDHIHENFTCDYFLRTNLSTFWAFDKLLARLDTLPQKNYLCGTGTNYPYLLKEDNERDRRLIYGYDMLFSSDVLTALLTRKDEILSVADHPLVKYFADDMLLSIYLLKELKLNCVSSIPFCLYIESISKEMYDGEKPNLEKIKKEIQKTKTKPIDHFRVKTFRDLKDRVGYDDVILYYLCETFYNRKVKFAIAKG